MNNKLLSTFKVAKYVTLLLPFLSLLNSCREDTGSLGANVLPKSDIISAYQTDTTKLITSMFLKDSTFTNAALYSMLGSYNDPILGQSKAAIYAEVSPSTNAYVPWESSSNSGKVTVDSVVLLLPLAGQAYGNLDAQTFEVYRTDSNITIGKTYYSDTTFPLQSSSSLCKEPIGSAQVNPPNGANPQTDTLRIKLSKNFMNYLVNESDFYWQTGFNINVMQGIYITTSNGLQIPGQGAILYINLSSAPFQAGIYAYYHFDTATVTSEQYVCFPIGSAGAYFNQFIHSYATSPIGAIHPSGPRDSVQAGQYVYVQGMAGILGRINFPNFYKNWSKLGHVVINEAVVTLPVATSQTNPNFPSPSSLYLVGTDSAYVQLGGYAYSGSPTYTSNGGSAFSFIVTPYIQEVVDGKLKDGGLYIVPGNSTITANSIVLYGAKHSSLPSDRACLTIYYTPLKTP